MCHFRAPLHVLMLTINSLGFLASALLAVWMIFVSRRASSAAHEMPTENASDIEKKRTIETVGTVCIVMCFLTLVFALFLLVQSVELAVALLNEENATVAKWCPQLMRRWLMRRREATREKYRTLLREEMAMKKEVPILGID
jgi:Ca2+/Na+ antiporter